MSRTTGPVVPGMVLGKTRMSLCTAFLLITVLPSQVCAQIQPSADISMATSDRLQGSGWWPTKGDAARTEYADPDACSGCHKDLAALQHTTPMYKASRHASDSELLEKRTPLSFDDGTFTYLLKHAPDGPSFTIGEQSRSESQEVVWAFGDGEIGQTYLFKKNGNYIESRLSYYTTTNALNITTGHSVAVPSTIEEAFGRLLPSQTTQWCFGCHTTMSTTSNVFSADSAVPGITCQACHGPGTSHITGIMTGSGHNNAKILNPGSLPPTASVDFCGACHRTWVDVTMHLPPNIGIIAIRFQPYRLEKSRCWGKDGDARITCIACHDPHRPLVHDLSTYDKNCLACHAGSAHAGRSKAAVCKVSTAKCVSCHMPKYVVPEAHASFTDHDIRIVHHGDPFPQ
jgi:hypothetical protein